MFWLAEDLEASPVRLWFVIFLQHCALQNRSSVVCCSSGRNKQLAWFRLAPGCSWHLRSADWQFRIDVSVHIQGSKIRLAPRCSWHLRSADWQFRIDVSVHLQGSKMGPIGCPEMSEPNYQSALCKIPEESSWQCRRNSDSNKLQKKQVQSMTVLLKM